MRYSIFIALMQYRHKGITTNSMKKNNAKKLN
jgi:hypothetical protein